MSSPAPHRERLWVPAAWWVVALVVGLPVAAALGIYISWEAVVGSLLVVGLGIVGALLWMGSARVEATDEGLRAGDFTIDWAYVGRARPLSAEATRRRLGPEADAEAALVVRPYVRTAVEVEIVDPEDPHPYWLVSSRRPTSLADAINARAAHAAGERSGS